MSNYKVVVCADGCDAKSYDLKNFVLVGIDKENFSVCHREDVEIHRLDENMAEKYLIELINICRGITRFTPEESRRMVADTLRVCIDKESSEISLKENPKISAQIKNSDDTEHRSPYAATVEGMLSPDYKERFKAEYQQLKIRADKLNSFCSRIEAAMESRNKVEEPKHDCSWQLLARQFGVMREYLHCLEVRAVIEGIEL